LAPCALAMEDIKTKILLVEDDKNLGFVIKDNLEQHGYDVTLCEDGEMGWKMFNKKSYDVCLLDVMLPKKDGFSLAEEIRKKNDMIPIIFTSAKSMKEDKLQGFKSGGDDYLTKPFSIEELEARIAVFLKRSTTKNRTNNVFQIGNYELDYNKMLLKNPSGGEQKLTQKEADLIRTFAIHMDKTLKREELLNAIWGDDDYFMGRSMDVFISKIRKYLKDDPRLEIVNVHGVGFKMTLHDH
jgi:DNA-binding response OmpR family regulator